MCIFWCLKHLGSAKKNKLKIIYSHPPEVEKTQCLKKNESNLKFNFYIVTNISDGMREGTKSIQFYFL